MFTLQDTTMENEQSQKGTVLVEFAFILPVFLLLLFGMITFSIALYNKTVLTMATREGARKGAVYVANRTNASIKKSAIDAGNAVCDNLVTFGDAATPSISTNGDPMGAKVLTVTASYPYISLYGFPNMALSAQTSMKLE
jgi:Flp pilus assembly protein TadG